MDISLTEALTGLKKAVKTLDDRTLVIQTVRGASRKQHRQVFISKQLGEVIKTGDLKMVRGEGMPQYRNPFEKGRLIIQVWIKEDTWMLFLDDFGIPDLYWQRYFSSTWFSRLPWSLVSLRNLHPYCHLRKFEKPS